LRASQRLNRRNAAAALHSQQQTVIRPAWVVNSSLERAISELATPEAREAYRLREEKALGGLGA